MTRHFITGAQSLCQAHNQIIPDRYPAGWEHQEGAHGSLRKLVHQLAELMPNCPAIPLPLANGHGIYRQRARAASRYGGRGSLDRDSPREEAGLPVLVPSIRAGVTHPRRQDGRTHHRRSCYRLYRGARCRCILHTGAPTTGVRRRVPQGQNQKNRTTRRPAQTGVLAGALGGAAAAAGAVFGRKIRRGA